MVLSAFSHYSLIHLGINMYVLWSFSGQLIDNMMGAEQYTAFYLAAGKYTSRCPSGALLKPLSFSRLRLLGRHRP